MHKSEIDHLIESRTSQNKKIKSLICGVGQYDVKFPRCIRIDGKMHTHRAYVVWREMLFRCYKPHSEHNMRNYAECTVCEEWLLFSNFLAFWKENHREGWHLDKDLLRPGNKFYSPEYCVFIPHALNGFTTDRACARGQFPQGVHWHKQHGRFVAQINVNGKVTHLGLFDNAQEAHLTWHAKKMQQAKDWKSICDEIHPNLHAGLMGKVLEMRYDCA
jgi:hypothetical protein